MAAKFATGNASCVKICAWIMKDLDQMIVILFLKLARFFPDASCAIESKTIDSLFCVIPIPNDNLFLFKNIKTCLGKI